MAEGDKITTTGSMSRRHSEQDARTAAKEQAMAEASRKAERVADTTPALDAMQKHMEEISTLSLKLPNSEFLAIVLDLMIKLLVALNNLRDAEELRIANLAATVDTDES